MRSLSGGLGDSVDLSSMFGDAGITDSSGSFDPGTISESPYPVIINGGPVTIPANSSGQLTAAQLASLVGSAASAGSAVIRSTQTPSVIAGTSAIYNPATGQIIPSAVGVGNPGSISAGLSVSPILIVLALVAVVGFMGGKR